MLQRPIWEMCGGDSNTLYCRKPQATVVIHERYPMKRMFLPLLSSDRWLRICLLEPPISAMLESV